MNLQPTSYGLKFIGQQIGGRTYMHNVLILSIAQAMALAGFPIVVLLGGIIGTELAPSPILVTFPAAIMVVGLAIFTLPAASLMNVVGRKIGFIGAAIMASLAALLAAYAIDQESFFLLCVATFFIGAQGAFVQQYRFAATESVEPAKIGRAVSFVLLGGIAAGFLGPEIAVRGSGLISSTQYMGSFIIMAGIYVLAAIVLLFYQEQERHVVAAADQGRSLRVIAAQPAFRLAVFSAAVSYGVMTFVMTATPVHLAGAHGYSLGTTSNIIKSHIAAMYAPSLITGSLIDRFGLPRVMTAGGVLLLASGLVGVGAATAPAYYLALILLGLGWNFLFVGATVLLTKTYTPGERFRSQALNDFLVFGVQAVASLSAGAALELASWEAINIMGMSLVLLTLVQLFRNRRQVQLLQPA
jgi:MFS family permease